jgi:3'-phosphoadenosine 5'-phosphosulfate sulfotransferase (PAPS reductase)/FAD synthetase
MAFNGGKDGLVLLHLCRRTLQKLELPTTSMTLFNIVLPRSFPELNAFAKEVAKEYQSFWKIL